MKQSRRRLLATFVSVAGSLAAQPVLSSAFAFQRTPQPIPSPNAPNPNYPPGLNNAGVNPNAEKEAKTVDPQRQKDIRADVQRLYEMAGELKDEVEKTDSNSVFSLSVVKKAQQIEKLAKRVKDMSKG